LYNQLHAAKKPDDLFILGDSQVVPSSRSVVRHRDDQEELVQGNGVLLFRQNEFTFTI